MDWDYYSLDRDYYWLYEVANCVGSGLLLVGSKLFLVILSVDYAGSGLLLVGSELFLVVLRVNTAG